MFLDLPLTAKVDKKVLCYTVLSKN